MTIDTQIDIIIKDRSQVAKRIEEVKSYLNSRSLIINELENKKDQMIRDIDDQDIITRLKVLDFPKIQRLIMNQLAVLNKMQMRFNRKNLSIAVVARAKQGKSRLLRSGTGLSENEIPDGDRGFCTGVASSISSSEINQKTYAKVQFYTPGEFLNERIAPYYKELNLGAVPNTIADFKRPLPKLPANYTDAIDTEKYKYLEKYHANIDKYEEYLLKTPPSQFHIFTGADIRKYVAQYDAQKNDTFDYMAVKECNISCPFTNAPAQKLKVFETQGLGETSVGDEERLIKVLGENVDIILFIRMPNSVADAWKTDDLNLYTVANRVLEKHLPLKKWSFLVLNQTNDPVKGNNSTQCDLLRNQIPDTMEVIDIITANCSDPNEVKTKILEPVVNESVKRIPQLDREYAAYYQQELNNLQTQIGAELEKASNALVKQTSVNNQQANFLILFQQFWKNITRGLEKLLRELRKEYEYFEDVEFKEQIKKTILQCKSDTKIPSDIEEIEERRDETGSYPRTYDDYLDDNRNYLTHHFKSLDTGLNRHIEELKSKIAEVMVEKCGLGGLTNARGSEFIQAMAELIPDQHPQIKKAFQELSSYNLSYKALIIPRIRKHLNPLTPDTVGIPLDPTISKPLPEQIKENLNELYKDAVYECDETLKKMSDEPLNAALASIEEFIDNILRAERADQGGMFLKWQLFLTEKQAEVWPQYFGNNQNNQVQEWANLVQQASQENNLENFKFLN